MSFLLRIACAALIACLWAASAVAQIETVRVVGDGQVTRVTMWSQSALDTEVLLSETHSRQQILVAIDGASAAVDGPIEPVSPATGVAGYGWQDGFLAITLARPMMVSRKLDLPPMGQESRHRIVIDLAAVSDVRFARTADRNDGRVSQRLLAQRNAAQTQSAALQPAPEGRAVVLEAPPEPGRYLVVIDPGHGGKDPGAIAASGLREKDVVLAASLTLRDILEASGRYRVKMTRSKDEFIELGERVSLARDWGADLFISIHADAAGNTDVAGASVYTISERGEGRIEGEAAKNDWHIEVEDGVSEEVTGILETLTIRETKTNSGKFAELLLPELAEAGPVLRNTHRKAGFYVLLAPDVPAVLLEIGFLTNPADARRLANAGRRRDSMEAVTDAIDAFFDDRDMVYVSN
ncbi:MAG: N-acetylmuramoyl-L-alanine amidase [Pseudomonadota bacterium]